MKTSQAQETTQTIYFATNRNPNNKSNPTNFGDKFSGSILGDLRFGEAQVLNGTLDRNTIRTLPDNSDEGSKTLLEDLRNTMRTQSRDSLIFIHGFNVTFTDAIESAAKLGRTYSRLSSQTQKYDPNIFVFSWPSNGKFLEYHNDLHDAEESGYAFARGLSKLTAFLSTICQEQACHQKINLIAHSMGAYVLRHTVQQTQKINRVAGSLPRLFDNIILAAADEDSDAFEHDHKLAKLPDLCQRVTVYFNTEDKALKISDTTKGNPDRLGHDGPRKPHQVSSKVVIVDVSAVVKANGISQIAEHSYHVEEDKVAHDIAAVLQGESSEEIASREYIAHANKFKIVKTTKSK